MSASSSYFGDWVVPPPDSVMPTRPDLRTWEAFMCCFMMILSLDLILNFGIKFANSKARWFALHGIVNLILAADCMPDVWTMLHNPVGSMHHNKHYSLWPAYLSATLHAYHMIMPWWRPLLLSDYFHHLCFAGCLGSAQLSYRWGPGSNLFMFFVCGLPGGIDYIMLSLVKQGHMASIDEKRYNSFINTWIRAPGCTACAFCIYACWVVGASSPEIPDIVIWMCILLCYSNGQYYGARVIASHATHQAKLQEDNSKTTR
eukprot:m.104579 g.104579  ORF g.104579 m.104579 type:complete len:259 (+) comp13847_c0_seq2:145-921(+)